MSQHAAPSSLDIVECGPGRLELRGPLTFATAASAHERLDAKLRAAGSGAIELSLGGVDRSDSAGLAVLIEAFATSRELGGRLRLTAIPANIEAMARISELEGLLHSAG